jgi:hypothetical protein
MRPEAPPAGRQLQFLGCFLTNSLSRTSRQLMSCLLSARSTRSLADGTALAGRDQLRFMLVDVSAALPPRRAAQWILFLPLLSDHLGCREAQRTPRRGS